MIARLLLCCSVAVFALLLPADEPSLADDLADPRYLADDLIDRIIASYQETGQLGLNSTVQVGDTVAVPLRIKDKAYSRGLGHLGTGETLVELSGRFQKFSAEIGVQWQEGKSKGSVIFRVLVDGEERFDSGIMREADPPRPVELEIAGAKQLRLITLNADDGSSDDFANWADARLTIDAAAVKAENDEGVDIAPFAHVVTSDPNRMKGTVAARSDEFPAEDVFLDQTVVANANGNYVVPVYGEHACIGLRWQERRYPRQLALRFDGELTPTEINLQYWASDGPVHYMSNGSSRWQGKWEILDVAPVQDGNQLIWNLGYMHIPTGTEKLRWIFQSTKEPITLTGFSVDAKTSWHTARLRVEADGSQPASTVSIECYNGEFIRRESKKTVYSTNWQTSEPVTLDVRYSTPAPLKSDRTLLQFAMPSHAFSVAVEDVVRHGSVHVLSSSLRITHESASRPSQSQPADRNHPRKVLASVRGLPDQTIASALEKVSSQVQNHGPMLLSLACDNRKFTVHRNGTVNFRFTDLPHTRYSEVFLSETVDKWFSRADGPVHFQMDKMDCAQLRPQFGSGTGDQIDRHLEGGWFPIPVTTIRDGQIVYRQRTYVAPLDKTPPPDAPEWMRYRAMCVVEYTVENRGDSDTAADLTIALFENAKDGVTAGFDKTNEGVLAIKDGRLLAAFDTSGAGPLLTTIGKGTITASGMLPPGGTASMTAYLPAWSASRSEVAAIQDGTRWVDCTKDYWTRLFSTAMQIELPDKLLTDLIRAAQVQCMLVARNDSSGQQIEPWISADRYGPMESEAQVVIRGMDMWGNVDFARRGLNYFVNRYNDLGYLTTGYTCVGTGQHLWTLAEHYDRTRDSKWLEEIAPKVARLCRWIIAQRAKTKQSDRDGYIAPESGLMPPGVSADWSRFDYRFFNDAHFCAGLREAGRVLGEIEGSESEVFRDAARSYAQDTRRAFEWCRARSPVLRLNDGTWVPGYPALMGAHGRVEDYFAGEDSGRNWCYNVELGAHHLAVAEILDPRSEETEWILDHMEDVEFLRSGMGTYPAEENRRDRFNRGGFAKMQPYYARHIEIYALRDDVKPFLRAYFNSMASLLNREVNWFWEHFNNYLGWNKTHELAWFLCQSRLMLVQERNDALWLAPFVTDNWLRHGMRIEVRQAPTHFGPVDYAISSSVNDGYIDVQIQPPTRNPPSEIVVRLRHPDEKPIRSVVLNGKPHVNFDWQAQVVRLPVEAEPMMVRVSY